MNLNDIVGRPLPAEPWVEGDNIPWDDPAFSKRMLAEHLTQEHDHASRRSETIDRQVRWIHEYFTGVIGCDVGEGFPTSGTVVVESPRRSDGRSNRLYGVRLGSGAVVTGTPEAVGQCRPVRH